MIEALFIIAIGVIIAFYLQREDDKKIIERQDYQLRHFTGNLNEKDKLESKNLLENHHFEMILYKVQNDNDFKWLDRDIQIEEAKRLFENKYGHKFSDPFNEY